ncbi:MAG: hypothetical protein VX927_03420, partial [SAR324 cluster bacterium]|nr:hypothetical protein [SAR324 cluster bacterium]
AKSPIPKPMNVIELAEIWRGTKFAMSFIVGCTTVLAQRSTMRFLVLRVGFRFELLKQIAVYFRSQENTESYIKSFMQ